MTHVPLGSEPNCLRCGYDLTSLPAEHYRCPECGWHRGHQYRKPERWRKIGNTIIIATVPVNLIVDLLCMENSTDYGFPSGWYAVVAFPAMIILNIVAWYFIFTLHCRTKAGTPTHWIPALIAALPVGFISYFMIYFVLWGSFIF